MCTATSTTRTSSATWPVAPKSTAAAISTWSSCPRATAQRAHRRHGAGRCPGRLHGNLLSAFTVMKHTIPLMPDRGGSIVCVGSRLGMVGKPEETMYSAAKGGLIALARGAAIELADRKIRVNVVAPGLTSTEIIEASFDASPIPRRTGACASRPFPCADSRPRKRWPTRSSSWLRPESGTSPVPCCRSTGATRRTESRNPRGTSEVRRPAACAQARVAEPLAVPESASAA